MWAAQVKKILSDGLNERFSGGLFGHGSYLAEECSHGVSHGVSPGASGEYGQKLSSRRMADLWENCSHMS